MLSLIDEQVSVIMVKYSHRLKWLQFMAQCERNYIELMSFFSKKSIVPGQTYAFNYLHHWALTLQVIDHVNYTSTMQLSFANTVKLKWLTPLCLTLRLYHDAELVEVISNHLPSDVLQATDKYASNDLLTRWVSAISNTRMPQPDKDRGDVN